ncbi:unnamed protein product [Urochloa decumbens]|uniref:F-box domain-containing protein n=1 Tax=Urochloa decumbens TaxID=240449 RepID=A0ABC9B0A7_9POAL
MSDQTTGGSRRASPLDDDDLLGEILLRVPPQPSSLPRVSLVCKRWRRIVSDPWFLRCFCAHHLKAPLLGFFEHRHLKDFVFNPILESPDHIPPQRFSLGRALAGMGLGNQLLLHGCRHGRVILTDMLSSSSCSTVFVCDPVTGCHERLVVPEEFTSLGDYMNATAVLCAASQHGYVHGACHSSPFKVILVYMARKDGRPLVCIYSSETGMWENIIRHGDHQCKIVEISSTLIAHSLYWKILYSHDEEHDEDFVPKPGVLKFNLERQSLVVLKGPPIGHFGRSKIIKTVDEGVGLATLSDGTMQLQVWHSNVNCHDVATWVLFKTVGLYNIFGLRKHESRRGGILGYDEDGGILFIYVDSSLFLLDLDSMQFKRHYYSIETCGLRICHPFRSFYTPGTATAGVGYDGDDILHDS